MNARGQAMRIACKRVAAEKWIEAEQVNPFGNHRSAANCKLLSEQFRDLAQGTDVLWSILSGCAIVLFPRSLLQARQQYI
jgi:hypothetical protein